LQCAGLRVLVIDKGEPGREASYAAGGMIAHCDPHLPSQLLALVRASAEMYRGFIGEIQDESGESVDLRDHGTLAFFAENECPSCDSVRRLDANDTTALEPVIVPDALGKNTRAYLLPECSVDPRALCGALVKAAKHRRVDCVSGSAVIEVETHNGRVAGVRTAHSTYAARIVVNCGGAWASQIRPFGPPTRPVKGQMVCVVPGPEHTGEGPVVQHVVRAPDVYIIPRTDRRVLLGATVEDAGFDKRTDANTIEKLYRAAAKIVPDIGSMRIHDAWAGLRPASPDNLPILGETSMPGYFAASGHYRDGIMMAPITAELITQLITDKALSFSLDTFSPSRFSAPSDR
jgi:glycine oxidase